MCLFGMFDRPTPKRRHKKSRPEMSHNNYTYRNQAPPRQYNPIPRPPRRDLQPNTAHLPRRVRKRSFLYSPDAPTAQKPPQYPPARTRTRTTNTTRPATSRPYSSHQQAPQIRHLTSTLLQRQTLSTRHSVLDSLLPKYQPQPRPHPRPSPSTKRQRRSTLPSFPPPPSPPSSSSSSSDHDRSAFSPRRRASTISSPPSSTSSQDTTVPIIQTYVQPPVLPLFEPYRPVGLNAYTDSEESAAGRSAGSADVRYRFPASAPLFSSSSSSSSASASASDEWRRSRSSAGGAVPDAICETRDRVAREMGRLDRVAGKLGRRGGWGGQRGSGYGGGFWGWD